MSFHPEILNMDIIKQEQEIKKKAIKNKQILRNFLEGFKIDDKSINDYIIFHMLYKIETTDSNDYTYWIDGGLSWLLWYDDNITKLNPEEKMSLTTGYLKFHYVIIKKDYQEKINEIYKFVVELKDKINEKLSDYGFELDISFHNISLNSDGKLDFNYDTKTLFKEPTFNIRLIIKKKSSGGGKAPKGKQINPRAFKPLGIFMDKIAQEQFKIKIEDFKRLSEDAFNGKIILDFRFEYFHQNEDRKLNIEEFRKTYLITTENKTYDDTELKLGYKSKLNRLNEIGMITYCLLNLSAIDDEFGLNVDKYRQQLFFRYKKNIPIFLEELLRYYNKFFKSFKSHNAFFIDKIREIIEKYKSPHFEIFKDFIDKWFMSMFRPYINSFILEINQELLENVGVKLFIAGGDAMRRYENDISFTKDIDTKLYIGNISQDKRGGRSDEKIKEDVVGIIVKHIVKLRNYLEENIQTIFEPLLRYDKRTKNRGTKVLTFRTSDNRIFRVDILLDDENKKKFQQFRTRENKKRIDFPVDLYSIDFRTFIGEYDISGNLLGKKKSHDISLLDVVLQDKDNYYSWYSTDVEGIPVASLEFLLEDFYKTYHMDDRALARISSGKVKKDIERFNKIKELYKNRHIPNQDNKGILQIPEIDEIIKLLNLKRFDIDVNIFNLFNEFLMKIKNKKTISILDIVGIINIFEDKTIQFILSKFPDLKQAIMDMIFFKKNIYNEKLSLTSSDYSSYIEDDDIIRQGYYELFYKLCSMKDGLVRHVMMFANSKIGIKTQSIKPTKSNRKRPRKTTKSSSSSSSLSPQPQPVLRTTRSGRISRPVNPSSTIPQPKKNRKPNSQPPLPSQPQPPLPSQPQPPLPSQPQPPIPSQPQPTLPPPKK